MIDSIYIPKQTITQSAGGVNSAAQVFTQSKFTKIEPNDTNYFCFNMPVFNINGATLNYYEQSLDAVSTNVENGKQYTLEFLENLFSLSGITLLNHELFRVKFEYYKEFLNDSHNSTLKSKIINNLNTPLITFSDVMTGATGVYSSLVSSNYNFTFPVKIKPSGNYTLELFQDKGQYLINPKFIFPKPLDQTYGDVWFLSGSSLQRLYNAPSQYELLSSSLQEHTISGNTAMSGATVKGAFFTYFVPPQKPDLNVSGGNGTKSVEGVLSTYSPTFNFNNVADGDYYRLQVSFNIDDFTFSDPNKGDYYINKQEGDADFVRTYSTSLTPNKKFIYRVGNTKELKNIFGVKQAMTAWTDAVEAETANDGSVTMSGTSYLNYIGGNIASGVTIQLIGVYTNSSVDIFVDSIDDTTIFTEQNSSIIPNKPTISYLITTGADGSYSFNGIEGGTYSMIITPPSELADAYSIQRKTINISSSIQLDIILSILWSNNQITFSYPATFL